MSDEQTTGPLQIRKYPNRRYYDTTRSRHVTLLDIYELVRTGRQVSVVESRTGRDITNCILMQIVLEREPAKLSALPTGLLHDMLRLDADAARGAVLHWTGTARPATPAEPSRPVESPTATPATASPALRAVSVAPARNTLSYMSAPSASASRDSLGNA